MVGVANVIFAVFYNLTFITYTQVFERKMEKWAPLTCKCTMHHAVWLQQNGAFMPLSFFHWHFPPAPVPTEPPSAGTPFTRCWQPGRRRCRPWRGSRAALRYRRCTWQSSGGVGGSGVSACPAWAGAEATFEVCFRSLQGISLEYILALALGLYRPEKTGSMLGFLDKSQGQSLL